MSLLLTGCRPEVAAGPDGRILAVGAGAGAAAGRGADVVRLRGRALPGLADSHIHLEGLARKRLELDLGGAPSLAGALSRVRAHASKLPAGAWVLGIGWYNDSWPDPAFPTRHHLDAAAGGRPVFLARKDGHSAWLSSAALAAAGFDRGAEVEGGVLDLEPDGRPAGIVREKAVEVARRAAPRATRERLDGAMLAALRGLLRLGLTSVHSMDTVEGFACLQRLHAAGSLPIRIFYNLPMSELKHAEALRIQSGFGDDRLRIWGVKAFLDGSLGSRTAEMLGGGGVSVMSREVLDDLAQRCVQAGLNICLHAIGDGAVRRALDALEPWAGVWSGWRPRIEHVQCCDPADWPRFRAAGVIASMQPIHAVSDIEVARREWPDRSGCSYAWAGLARAGARLAFGSDAPVESASPLLGLDAATGWRRRVGWHPELALTPAAALRAYTYGAAYAVGMERRLGRLAPGMLCDVTVVEAGRVVATVVGGRVSRRQR